MGVYDSHDTNKMVPIDPETVQVSQFTFLDKKGETKTGSNLKEKLEKFEKSVSIRSGRTDRRGINMDTLMRQNAESKDSQQVKDKRVKGKF